MLNKLNDSVSMTEFFRFPHTPHLAWLSDGTPRADKVLTQEGVERLLASELTVEEKIDGANLGLSVSDEGALRVQNRGGYLERGNAHRQFRPLVPWLSAREEALVDALSPNLMLFGEWCVAVHSVSYDALPDWFLGFDVYDLEKRKFWSTDRRDELLSMLNLSRVPTLGRGHFSLSDLNKLLGPSRVGHEPMEGLVVRREQDGHLLDRAKLVRAEFTQSIETHWSRRPMRRNRRAVDAAVRGGVGPCGETHER